MTERKKSRILVVDDHLPSLKGVSRLLEHAGHDTAEAATGSEALRIAKEFKPDLILLDVVLPDMEGTEVCKAIKADEDSANIHVILMSRLMTASDSQAEGLDVGADGYIARPIPNREFLARVNALLRIKSLEKRLLEALDFTNALLAASPVGIATLRADGTMITANEAMLAIIGRTAKDVPKLVFEETHLGKSKGLWEESERVLKTGTAGRREILAEPAPGEKVWLDCILNSFDSGADRKLVLIAVDVTERKKSESRQKKLLEDLELSLSQVKRLSGLLPVCSVCKKVRDDEGFWQEIDSYMNMHSDAQVSHGICPDCYKKHYSEFIEE